MRPAWSLRAIAVLFAAILPLSGCALTTGHVDLTYEPMAETTKVARPNSPHVTVEVLDKRPTQAVGQKINGLGMKSADIVPNSDVPALLKSAFETELSNRGFSEGTGGNTILVRLGNFQNQYKLGLISGEATASMGMEVSVIRADGSVAYKRYIRSERNDWVEITGEDNAQRMLNAAMRDAVAMVFNDHAFIEAVTKS